MYVCKLCNKEFKNFQGLSRHLSNQHKNISKEDYYDKYINLTENKLCPICKKNKRKFIRLSRGYNICCENKKCIDKYIFMKRENTLIERYGFKNPFQLVEVKNKIKENCIKKYGVEFNSQRNDIIKKMRYSKKINDSDIPFGSNKFKKIMLQKYGVEHNSYIPEVIEKRKQTKLNNIDGNGLNSYQRGVNKIKENCIKKYGVPNPFLINKSSYSKISQELFWSIYNRLSKKYQKYCHFAELNNEFYKYDIKEKKYYAYDFVITKPKKICIEFNGDKWHANPELYSELDTPNPFNKKLTSKDIWKRDNIKYNYIKNLNFKLNIIWQKDYYNNKEKVINKILEDNFK